MLPRGVPVYFLSPRLPARTVVLERTRPRQPAPEKGEGANHDAAGGRMFEQELLRLVAVDIAVPETVVTLLRPCENSEKTAERLSS